MADTDEGLLRRARDLLHEDGADVALEPLGREELLALLRRLADEPLAYRAHALADAALLRYIADPGVRRAYAVVWKGYR